MSIEELDPTRVDPWDDGTLAVRAQDDEDFEDEDFEDEDLDDEDWDDEDWDEDLDDEEWEELEEEYEEELDRFGGGDDEEEW